MTSAKDTKKYHFINTYRNASKQRCTFRNYIKQFFLFQHSNIVLVVFALLKTMNQMHYYLLDHQIGCVQGSMSKKNFENQRKLAERLFVPRKKFIKAKKRKEQCTDVLGCTVSKHLVSDPLI